jgi:hypothetical protein
LEILSYHYNLPLFPLVYLPHPVIIICPLPFNYVYIS